MQAIGSVQRAMLSLVGYLGSEALPSRVWVVGLSARRVIRVVS